MTEFENGSLKKLFGELNEGLEQYKANKKFDSITIAFPMLNFVSEFFLASSEDRAKIEETLITSLNSLQDNGLDNAQSFSLIRTLCNRADKEQKNIGNIETSEFLDRLAQQGLKKFISLSHENAKIEGQNPEVAAFNDIAAARIQATGSMGKIFQQIYNQAKPSGKIQSLNF